MALTAEQVQQYYQTILQRPATDAQVAVAVATGQSAGDLISALISTSEAGSFVFPILQVYQAVFGRVPDAAGLDFWVDEYRGGTSLEVITQGFVHSDEFVATYGDVTDGSDPAFIQALYQNVLGRPGEAAGIAFWTSPDKAGINPADVVRLFAMDAEFTAKAQGPITQFLTDAANEVPDVYVGSLFDGIDQNIGEEFLLTAGLDNYVGTSLNDTFIAGDVTSGGVASATFTTGDKIDGGAGADTLTVVQNASFTGLPTGATVSNVETVNVTSGGAITLNATSFAGTTALNTTTSGFAQTITAAATTDVTINAAALAGANVAVNGGDDVTVNATGSQGGAIGVGATTAAAGAVTVNSTIATPNGSTGAGITVNGGTEVVVTQKGANAVNTTVTDGAVTVLGNANTTSVTVINDKAATATATVVGHANNNVTITDVNAASLTAAGTIETVTLSSFNAATVNSGALTTLNLSGTGVSVNAANLGALTTVANTALAVNVDGLTTTGAVTIDTDITTLNLAGSNAASTIASLSAGGVKSLNVSGDAKLAISANTLTALTDITVTNTAGFQLAGAAINTGATFTGGAGDDAVVLGATTKVITMGAGNDKVTSTGLVGTGGKVDAGDGIDTIVMTSAQAAVADDDAVFNTKFTNFEVLELSDTLGATTLNLTGINSVSTVVLNVSATNTPSCGSVAFMLVAAAQLSGLPL